MVDKIKSMYAKIKLREMRKPIDDPNYVYPFEDMEIFIYLLIAGLWITLLLIAFYYA